MAIKVNAGDFKRSDLFSVYPEEIIVDLAANGRAHQQSDEEVAALAESIRERGQLQPVLVRRVEDYKLQLVAGYGRHRAVMLLNKGKAPEDQRRIDCYVIDCSPEDATVLNIVENNGRTEVNAVDDAANMARLRRMQWPEEKIAQFYDCSVSKVSQRLRLAAQPQEVKEAVANGTVTVTDAGALATMPEADQRTAVANGKVKETVKARRKTRSLADLKSLLEGMTRSGESTERGRVLAAHILGYFGGTVTAEELTAKMS